MKRDLIKYSLVIIITLIASSMVILANKIKPIENKNFHYFPTVVGKWQAENIPMDKSVYKSLETPYALLRNYYSPQYPFPVNLAAVWYDDRYFAFHAPESCLGGIGNHVKYKGTSRILLMNKYYDVGKLIVEQNNYKQMVIYFYDVDGFITTSQSALRLHVLMKRFQLKRASVSFFRLMVPISDSEEKSIESIKEFLNVLYPEVPKYIYIGAIGQ